MNDINYYLTLFKTNSTLSTNISKFNKLTPASFNWAISKEALPIQKRANVVYENAKGNANYIVEYMNTTIAKFQSLTFILL